MKKRITGVVLALCMALSLLPAGALAAAASSGQAQIEAECVAGGGHYWDAGVTTPQNTCQHPGNIKYTCTKCGAIKTEELAPVHTWDDGRVTTPATTTSTGVMTYTCKVCMMTKTEVIPIHVPAPSRPRQTECFLKPVDAIPDVSDRIAVSSYADLCAIGRDDAHPLGGSYYLTADIQIPADKAWVPIGPDEDHQFTGVFDGQGYFVAGLTFDCSAQNMTGLGGYGLFGMTDCATIRNLGVDAIDIHTGTAESELDVGGIVGAATQTNIDNCYACGKIVRDGASYMTCRTGGICGSNTGSKFTAEGHSKLTSILADVNISVQYVKDGVTALTGSAGGVSGGGYDEDFENCVCGRENSKGTDDGIMAEYAGGIVGGDDPNGNFPVIIKDCVNRKPVTGGEYTGGILGSGSVNITGCTNYAVVTGSGTVGGILGDSTHPTIARCVNRGDVIKASQEEAGSVGGILGRTAGGGDITDCENHANVNSYAGSYEGYDAGGIVGSYAVGSLGTISGCVNDGGVSVYSSPPDRDGQEVAAAGGICGYLFHHDGDAEPSNATVVKSCRNSGDVSAHIYCTDGDAYAGGIVGWAETEYVTTSGNRMVWIHVSDCTNTGSISAVSNYDHVKNADKEGYIRSYVGATAYAGGICGIAMPDVRFTDCIADAAQTSASVDDPNDSESFPRRASTAAVSGGTPQIEGTQTVNGQGCNNVAVTIQNNAGEYLTGSSGANLEAAAGSPGAQQRYRLVTCSDGTFAIQSCVSLRYLSVGFPVLKVDGLKVSKNSSADFSSPAITGACEKFRFVKYNPDTGEYENASFQALPDSSAGFICFIRSENGVLLAVDDTMGIYATDDRNHVKLFTVTVTGSFDLTDKDLGIIHNPGWLNLDGSGQGGYWDIQNELGSGSTASLERLGYTPMRWDGWHRTATAKNVNIIKIGNMECAIGVKVTTDGGYDVIVDFQGTGGYGGGSSYRDAMSNLSSGITEAQHEGYRAMAYKLINERFNVRTYFNGIHLTLEDLIVKAATDGSAHFTVMGHSMGGAIAQCFGLYLATKRGISPAEIRGRTFESALALADDGGKYSSDAYYASFTDWYNLCVDSDSVSNGTIPFSILDKSGIHRLGYTVTLEDPYPDKDVESLSPLYIATQIVVSKHNMDCALETLLRAHQSHDLGSGEQSLQNQSWSYEAVNRNGVLMTCPDSAGYTLHTFPQQAVYFVKSSGAAAYASPSTDSEAVRQLAGGVSADVYSYAYNAKGTKFYEIGDDAAQGKTRLWVEGDKLTGFASSKSPIDCLQKFPCDLQLLVIADGERLYSAPAGNDVIRQMKKFEVVRAVNWVLDSSKGERWYELADPDSGWVMEDALVPQNLSRPIEALEHWTSIMCPVDITVQDSAGNTVLTIENNAVTKNTTGGRIVPLILNDEKQLYFYDAAAYKLLIKATDSDTFTYILRDLDLTAGTYGAGKTFRFAVLTAGKTLSTTVGGKAGSADAALLVLDSSGNPVSKVGTDGTETPIAAQSSGLQPAPGTDTSTTTIGGLAVTTPAGGAPAAGSGGVTTLPDGGTVKTDGGTLKAPAGTTVGADGTVTVPLGTSGTLTLPGGTTVLLSGGTVISGKNIIVGQGGAQASLKNGGMDSFGPGTVIIPDSSVPLGFRTEWNNPFTDVSEKDWYCECVSQVCLKGLMTGISATSFGPGMHMTRGMLVTVLWRMEGSPAAKSAAPFADVKPGAYYAKAVAWAAENNIVNGFGANYDPDADVTREQAVTILYRYARFKGIDVSVGEDTNILSYEDASAVSEYAVPAMQWACGAGLVNGSAGKLMPDGSATRAQTAAMLSRFCKVLK